MLIRSIHGFSVLELLVVMTIFALLTTLALPQFVSLESTFARSDSLQRVEFDLRRAKSEALAAGARTVVSFDDRGQGYSIGFDYLPFNDPPAADEIFLNETLPSTISLNSESSTIIFDSRGFLIDDAGSPTTVDISLVENGAEYGTASISATGAITFAVGSNGETS